MNNQDPQNSKTAQLGEFANRYLQEDIIDIENLPLRETSVNLVMSTFKLAVTAVNLVFSACQFGFSLLLAAGDLLAKGLAKVLPAPKTVGEKRL